MKKTALLALVFTLLLFLVSCNGNDGAPDGMQLVRGGNDVGYYFYAPEEWTVANNGEISAAYTSKLDVTSMTFAPASAPMADMESYFESALSEFTYELTNTPTLESCDFGNATSAYKTVYEFKYENYDFRAMQIFVSYGERFYIFTYTAQLVERTSGETYYDFYLSDIQSVIQNFTFTDITEAPAPIEYEKDSDGYLLVSDKNICGYDLYIHPDWSVRYAAANIGALTTGGASLNITESTSVGVSRDEYWERRQTELSQLVTNLHIEGEHIETRLGNSTWAFAYEYTYTYASRQYHVYQIVAVVGTWPLQDGYVFTYTAPEDIYDDNLDEVLKMIEKVNFR